METKHETKFKLFKRIVLFTAFLGIGFIFSSCFVDYGLDTTNYDVVVTYHDTTYNFAPVTTYYLSDTVKHVGEGISSAYDNTIKTQIQTNLNKLGWTQAGYLTANVRVMPAISSSTYVTYDYWGYYGWGWYYPYYPTVSYTYTTGSVFVLLVDPSKANTSTTTQPVQWIAVCNGLANGSSPTSRIQAGIDKAFSQSPYLNQ